jgi:GNAT superfamily N-acetyltransferase
MAIELREARPGDELTVAEVHVRSWQEGYRGLMPDEFLDSQRPEDRVGRYTFGASEPGAPLTLLAVEVDDDDAETLLGFVTVSSSRDEDAGGLGEVAALYVDPVRYQGGVGRALMAEAGERLRAQGFAEAVLWVLDGNDRAARFYEREGWTPDGARRFEDPYDIPSHVSRFRRAL